MFRFSYCNFNGYDIAYNWKSFSTQIVETIWRIKNKTEPPMRPHFIINGYKKVPTHPVALLVSDPVVRFIAACHEDGIEPEEALLSVKEKKFPSFHFFPQSRFLSFGNQEIHLWRAKEHIQHFWDTIGLGVLPQIYTKKIEFNGIEELRDLYSDDFALYESIKNPQTIIKPKNEIKPSLLDQMKGVGFAVKKFSASGFKQTTKEILEERESICRSCEQWDATQSVSISESWCTVRG